jgi:hypothetical protein
MRNTILATVVALGLSSFAFAATTPATSATPAAPAAPAAAAPAPAPAAKPAAKPNPKVVECEKEAKEKNLKGAERKKFVADCVKAAKN